MIYSLEQKKQSVITCTLDYEIKTHNFDHDMLLKDTLSAMNKGNAKFYYSHFDIIKSKIQFTFKRQKRLKMFIILYRGSYVGDNHLPVEKLEDARIFSYNEAQLYIANAKNCRIESINNN